MSDMFENTRLEERKKVGQPLRIIINGNLRLNSAKASCNLFPPPPEDEE